jgi:hypothetical protein
MSGVESKIIKIYTNRSSLSPAVAAADDLIHSKLMDSKLISTTVQPAVTNEGIDFISSDERTTIKLGESFSNQQLDAPSLRLDGPLDISYLNNDYSRDGSISASDNAKQVELEATEIHHSSIHSANSHSTSHFKPVSHPVTAESTEDSMELDFATVYMDKSILDQVILDRNASGFHPILLVTPPVMQTIGNSVESIASHFFGDDFAYWETLVQLIFKSVTNEGGRHLATFLQILDLNAIHMTTPHVISSWVLEDLAALREIGSTSLERCSRIFLLANSTILVPILIETSRVDRDQLLHIFNTRLEYLLYICVVYRSVHAAEVREVQDYLVQKGVNNEALASAEMQWNIMITNDIDRYWDVFISYGIMGDQMNGSASAQQNRDMVYPTSDNLNSRLFGAVVEYCKASRPTKEEGNKEMLTKSFGSRCLDEKKESAKLPVVDAMKNTAMDSRITHQQAGATTSVVATERLSNENTSTQEATLLDNRVSKSSPKHVVRSSQGDTISAFAAKARIASGILSKDNNNINESKDYRLETKCDNLVVGQESGREPDPSGLLGSIPTSDPSRPQSLVELSGVSSRPDTLTRPKESIITGPFSDPNNNRGQTSTVGNQILHNSGRQESATITSVALAVHNQNVETTKANQQLGFRTAPDLTKEGSRESKKFQEVKLSNNPSLPFNQITFPASTFPLNFEPKEQTFSILTTDSLWESLQRMVSNIVDFKTPGIMAVLVEINRDSNKFIKDSVYWFYDRHPTLRDNWEEVLIYLGINEDTMAEEQRLYLSQQFIRNHEGKPAEAFIVFAAKFIRQVSRTGAITSVKSKVSQAYKDFVEVYDRDIRADMDDYLSFHTPSDLITLVTRGVINSDFNSVAVSTKVPVVQQNSVPLKEKVVAEKRVLTPSGPKRQTTLQKFCSTLPTLKRGEVELKAPKKGNVAHLTNSTKGHSQPNKEKTDNYQKGGARNPGSARKGSVGNSNNDSNNNNSSKKDSNNSNKDNSNKGGNNNSNNNYINNNNCKKLSSGAGKWNNGGSTQKNPIMLREPKLKIEELVHHGFVQISDTPKCVFIGDLFDDGDQAVFGSFAANQLTDVNYPTGSTAGNNDYFVGLGKSNLAQHLQEGRISFDSQHQNDKAVGEEMGRFNQTIRINIFQHDSMEYDFCTYGNQIDFLLRAMMNGTIMSYDNWHTYVPDAGKEKARTSSRTGFTRTVFNNDNAEFCWRSYLLYGVKEDNWIDDGTIGMSRTWTTCDWITNIRLILNCGIIQSFDRIDKCKRLVPDEYVYMDQFLVPESLDLLNKAFASIGNAITCQPDATSNLPATSTIRYQLHFIGTVGKSGGVIDYQRVSVAEIRARVLEHYRANISIRNFTQSANADSDTLASFGSDSSILKIETVMANMCSKGPYGQFIQAVPVLDSERDVTSEHRDVISEQFFPVFDSERDINSEQFSQFIQAIPVFDSEGDFISVINNTVSGDLLSKVTDNTSKVSLEESVQCQSMVETSIKESEVIVETPINESGVEESRENSMGVKGTPKGGEKKLVMSGDNSSNNKSDNKSNNNKSTSNKRRGGASKNTSKTSDYSVGRQLPTIRVECKLGATTGRKIAIDTGESSRIADSADAENQWSNQPNGEEVFYSITNESVTSFSEKLIPISSSPLQSQRESLTEQYHRLISSVTRKMISQGLPPFQQSNGYNKSHISTVNSVIEVWVVPNHYSNRSTLVRQEDYLIAVLLAAVECVVSFLELLPNKPVCKYRYIDMSNIQHCYREAGDIGDSTCSILAICNGKKFMSHLFENLLSNISIGDEKTDGGLAVQQEADRTAAVNQSDLICIFSSPNRRKTCMSPIRPVETLALGFIVILSSGKLESGDIVSVDIVKSGVNDNVFLAKVARKMHFCSSVQDSSISVLDLPRSIIMVTTRDLLVLWSWKCLANTLLPNQVVKNTVSGGFQVLDQYQQSPRISKSLESGYSLIIRCLIYWDVINGCFHNQSIIGNGTLCMVNKEYLEMEMATTTVDLVLGYTVELDISHSHHYLLQRLVCQTGCRRSTMDTVKVNRLLATKRELEMYVDSNQCWTILESCSIKLLIKSPSEKAFAVEVVKGIVSQKFGLCEEYQRFGLFEEDSIIDIGNTGWNVGMEFSGSKSRNPFVDMSVCSNNNNSIVIILLEENPCTKCDRNWRINDVSSVIELVRNDGFVLGETSMISERECKWQVVSMDYRDLYVSVISKISIVFGSDCEEKKNSAVVIKYRSVVFSFSEPSQHLGFSMLDFQLSVISPISANKFLKQCPLFSVVEIVKGIVKLVAGTSPIVFKKWEAIINRVTPDERSMIRAYSVDVPTGSSKDHHRDSISVRIVARDTVRDVCRAAVGDGHRIFDPGGHAKESILIVARVVTIIILESLKYFSIPFKCQIVSQSKDGLSICILDKHVVGLNSFLRGTILRIFKYLSIPIKCQVIIPSKNQVKIATTLCDQISVWVILLSYVEVIIGIRSVIGNIRMQFYSIAYQFNKLQWYINSTDKAVLWTNFIGYQFLIIREQVGLFTTGAGDIFSLQNMSSVQNQSTEKLKGEPDTLLRTERGGNILQFEEKYASAWWNILQSEEKYAVTFKKKRFEGRSNNYSGAGQNRSNYSSGDNNKKPNEGGLCIGRLTLEEKSMRDKSLQQFYFELMSQGKIIINIDRLSFESILDTVKTFLDTITNNTPLLVNNQSPSVKFKSATIQDQIDSEDDSIGDGEGQAWPSELVQPREMNNDSLMQAGLSFYTLGPGKIDEYREKKEKGQKPVLQAAEKLFIINISPSLEESGLNTGCFGNVSTLVRAGCPIFKLHERIADDLDKGMMIRSQDLVDVAAAVSYHCEKYFTISEGVDQMKVKSIYESGMQMQMRDSINKDINDGFNLEQISSTDYCEQRALQSLEALRIDRRRTMSPSIQINKSTDQRLIISSDKEEAAKYTCKAIYSPTNTWFNALKCTKYLVIILISLLYFKVEGISSQFKEIKCHIRGPMNRAVMIQEDFENRALENKRFNKSIQDLCLIDQTYSQCRRWLQRYWQQDYYFSETRNKGRSRSRFQKETSVSLLPEYIHSKISSPDLKDFDLFINGNPNNSKTISTPVDLANSDRKDGHTNDVIHSMQMVRIGKPNVDVGQYFTIDKGSFRGKGSEVTAEYDRSVYPQSGPNIMLIREMGYNWIAIGELRFMKDNSKNSGDLVPVEIMVSVDIRDIMDTLRVLFNQLEIVISDQTWKILPTELKDDPTKEEIELSIELSDELFMETYDSVVYNGLLSPDIQREYRLWTMSTVSREKAIESLSNILRLRVINSDGTGRIDIDLQFHSSYFFDNKCYMTEIWRNYRELNPQVYSLETLDPELKNKLKKRERNILSSSRDGNDQKVIEIIIIEIEINTEIEIIAVIEIIVETMEIVRIDNPQGPASNLCYDQCSSKLTSLDICMLTIFAELVRLGTKSRYYPFEDLRANSMIIQEFMNDFGNQQIDNLDEVIQSHQPFNPQLEQLNIGGYDQNNGNKKSGSYNNNNSNTRYNNNNRYSNPNQNLGVERVSVGRVSVGNASIVELVQRSLIESIGFQGKSRVNTAVNTAQCWIQSVPLLLETIVNQLEIEEIGWTDELMEIYDPVYNGLLFPDIQTANWESEIIREVTDLFRLTGDYREMNIQILLLESFQITKINNIECLDCTWASDPEHESLNINSHRIFSRQGISCIDKSELFKEEGQLQSISKWLNKWIKGENCARPKWQDINSDNQATLNIFQLLSVCLREYNRIVSEMRTKYQWKDFYLLLRVIITHRHQRTYENDEARSLSFTKFDEINEYKDQSMLLREILEELEARDQRKYSREDILYSREDIEELNYSSWRLANILTEWSELSEEQLSEEQQSKVLKEKIDEILYIQPKLLGSINPIDEPSNIVNNIVKQLHTESVEGTGLRNRKKSQVFVEQERDDSECQEKADIVRDKVRRVFLTFGFPKNLVTDHGFSLKNLLQETRSDAKLERVSPVAARVNKGTENAMRLIKDILVFYINKYQSEMVV